MTAELRARLRRAAALLLALAPALALAGQWQAGAELGLRHSRWQERTEHGQVLLQERGILHGLSLAATRTTPQGHRLRLQWQAWGVRRAYDGQTNQGRPVQTVTDVREQVGVLGLDTAVGQGWHLGLSVQPHRVRRGLRGVASVAGYEESWRWTQALATLEGRGEAGRLQGWFVHAAWGRPLQARMRTSVPGTEAITVAPKGRDTVQVGIGVERAGLAGWCARCRWHLGLQVQQTRFAASDPVPLRGSAGIVGQALQPATRTRDGVWRAGLELPWP